MSNRLIVGATHGPSAFVYDLDPWTRTLVLKGPLTWTGSVESDESTGSLMGGSYQSLARVVTIFSARVRSAATSAVRTDSAVRSENRTG